MGQVVMRKTTTLFLCSLILASPAAAQTADSTAGPLPPFFTWRDGLTLWVSTTKMPLRDPKGNIIGTFGITRDITERKQMEEALRRRAEH